jgi:hypothetical protein
MTRGRIAQRLSDMESHYTNARITYSGLVPKSVEPTADGAVVSVLDGPSLAYIQGFELNRVKVDGIPAVRSKWQQPPHVALANWRFDSVERVCTFTKLYGALEIRVETVKLSRLKTYQEIVRSAWRGGHAPLWQGFQPQIQSGEILIDIGDLWPYISLLTQTDLHAERLAVCPNIDNDCPSPYFIRTRRNQQFCSVECRNYFNVQRWRSDPKNVVREKKRRKKREHLA